MEEDIEFLECTPPEIMEMAKEATNNLLPNKSKKIYMTTYEEFFKMVQEQKC